MYQVLKRDGKIVDFDLSRITGATKWLSLKRAEPTITRISSTSGIKGDRRFCSRSNDLRVRRGRYTGQRGNQVDRGIDYAENG